MKYLWIALLLVSVTPVYAQRFDLNVSGGAQLNFSSKNIFSGADEYARITGSGSLEFRYHPMSDITLGLGVSGTQLSTGVQLNFTDNNGHLVTDKIKVYAAKPAIALYLIAGTNMTIGKYVLRPELTGGYVSAQKGSHKDLTINLGNGGNGSMLGMQLLLGRRISKHLLAGIRTGVRYFAINYEDGSYAKSSKTVAVPLGAGITIMF